MAVKDGEIADMNINVRGDPHSKGDKIKRRGLTFIKPNKGFSCDDKSSGRLKLATWMTQPDHPLTSRVIVNRIWYWHFGKGIVEHEQVFDLLRKNGPEIINDTEISVSGTGSWKNFIVTNIKTGEVIVEKKFYKSQFNEIMSDPEYSGYIDNLLEKTMVRKLSQDPDIDVDSLSEVEAAVMEMELGGLE